MQPPPAGAGPSARQRRRRRRPRQAAAAAATLVLGLGLAVALCCVPQPARGFGGVRPPLPTLSPRRAPLGGASGTSGGSSRCWAPRVAMALGGGGGPPSKRICIIGGGAAGFMAAIHAGRGVKGVEGAEVVLLEGTKKVLHKVSISGGGRCNCMHDHRKPPKEIAQNYPRGQRELLGPLTSAFGPQETYEWFTQSLGVPLKTEGDGRMFPTTDDSASIVDALRKAATEAGVKVETGAKARAITPLKDNDQGRLAVAIETSSPSSSSSSSSGAQPPFLLPCACVLLATGSSREGHAMAAALGHTIAPPVPSLFTLELGKGGGNPLLGLAGISVAVVEVKLLGPAGGAGGAKAFKETLRQAGLSQRAQASLMQRGPLLVTHSGLSGPAILRLSAFGARVLHVLDYKARIAVDWAPDLELADVVERLARAKAAYPKKAVATFCPLPLPGTEENPGGPEPRISRRLWARLVAGVGLGGGEEEGPGGGGAATTWGAASAKALNLLAERIKGSVYDTTGKGAFKDEFVTCGGVSLGEVDLKTMESKKAPGLFVAGEAADIDGVTGGYNFQAAWTTGFLAGSAMARRVRGEGEGEG